MCRLALGLFLLAFISITACQPKTDTLFKLLEPDDTGITFSNNIAESDTFNILTNEYIYNGGGVAAADFNNDGLTDLFFTGNSVANKLYINKGGLKFEDVSATAGVEASDKWSQGIATVDINMDGLLDIYVCVTMHRNATERENLLFVNRGLNEDGIPVFEEQAKKYGINDDGWSTNAAFFDYDKDGDLDLYVLTNVQSDRTPVAYAPKVTDGTATNNDRLYKNNGDGTFALANEEAGITYEGYGLGLAISDVNGDSWPDIYVSNDFLSNDLLYINNGDGTFTNKLSELIGHSSQFSMGNDIGDVNNDGWVDIITLDMLPETNFRKKTTIGKNVYQIYLNNERYGYEYQHVRNMLQLNNGPGIPFSEIGFLSEIFETDWSWSPLLADVDNDGDRDLLVTNGFPKDITDKDFASYRADVGNIAGPAFLVDSIPVVKISNFAFENNGDLTFKDVTKQWGLYKPSFSNGAAFADLDNDGDLDYVVNTINEPALVYENTLIRAGAKSDSSHYLRVRLEGNKANQLAIGASVVLKYGESKMQFHDHSIYRGFLSSVEPVVHFGLGRATAVDTVIVNWYDGKTSLFTNVAADQVLVASHASASSGDNLLANAPVIASTGRLFTEAGGNLGIRFRHSEDDKIDFNLQRTLPHKFTQYGPAVAVGDINGDNLEDFVTGGSSDRGIQFFLQRKDGTFESRPGPEKADSRSEYLGLLLFDLDGDTDLDLYAVSGSIEYPFPSDVYRDHIYLNNGKGEFSFSEQLTSAHPQTSGSSARAADFDRDGDLDLFVGGRVVPAAYPLPAQSVLLENRNGTLVDVTEEKAPFLKELGLVTDMLWTDYDNDGLADMLVAGEFMPLTFVKNEGDSFSLVANTGIEMYSGWWNSLAAGDFDNDGDTDYVAGNLGANNYYRATIDQPLRAYAKDVDKNGSVDLILSCYFKTETGEMQEFPLHFWDEMNSQSPRFRKMFSRYKQFGRAPMSAFVEAQELSDGLILEATWMRTSYVENLGNGMFRLRAMPTLAQIAPVYGMVSDDFDSDGKLDVLMVGNDYGNEVFAGKYDAFTGLLLKGNGQGNFEPVTSSESGFVVSGDAKALVKLRTGSGRPVYIASQNKADIKVYETPAGEAEGELFVPKHDDFYAVIEYRDGTTEKVEFYHGSGFLSQSSRKLRFPASAKLVTIYSYSGESRTLELVAAAQ